MFTERFFIFRIFLLGESALWTPGKAGNGLAGESLGPRLVVVAMELVLKDLKDAIGNIDVADSGEELGEGSVRAESSMVDTVVVGEDSADSKVEAESLRSS